MSTLTYKDLQRAIEMLNLPTAKKYDTIVMHSDYLTKEIEEKLYKRGLKPYGADHLTERVQYFKPRTKRKRIQKKARKLYMREQPSNKVYLIRSKSMQMTSQRPTIIK